MEWMYQKEEVEQKEYLLGKKISSVPTQAGPNTNVPSAYDIPGALFKFDSERAQTRAENDMKAKMREDPLFQIREREEEVRRKILKNPVKIRELQKAQEAKHSGSKKKEKKKRKKKSREDSSDSGDDLLQQYLAVMQKDKQRKKKSESSCSDEWEERTAVSSKQREHQKAYGLLAKDGSSDGPGSRDREEKTTDRRLDSHNRERRRDRDQRPRRHDRLERSERDRPYQRRSRSPRRHRRDSPKHSRTTKGRSPDMRPKKLTGDEKQRRLQEMMANAAWRDEDRRDNVKHYKKEEDKEQEKLEDKGGSFAESYLNPMMAKHASGSSLEDRLQRNKFNVQRTHSAMDKNSYQK